MTSSERVFEYTCVCCDIPCKGTPAFGYDMPIEVMDIPEDERLERVWLDADICAIDDRQFFVKGLLDIPVQGVKEPLSWGLWVTQTEEELNAYEDTRGSDRTGVVTRGQITVTMPGYHCLDQSGKNHRLSCELIGQPCGLRPIINLHPSKHILYRDHKFGISWDRAIELVARVPHH
ncbi:DUF2199 domain-containing protein [Tritonibacter horizontis]|uniref:DUF2199 domain-containing protein n=1 Tax=Tritonibacter horizontis TaxID=1768241 RepID=UPI0009E7C8EC|nr:DUF2199 domain-containing protein [Tritonibacter horizontis]